MPGRRRVPGRNVAIAFDAEVLEAIDETAHDLVMGRSTLVNRICRNWLENYQIPAASSAKPTVEVWGLAEDGPPPASAKGAES